MRSLGLVILGLALGAGQAWAQFDQESLKLNLPLASQYLTVGTKTGLEGNAAYTLESWVYPTTYAGFPTIIGNNYRTSYWLGLNTLGHVRFYPRGGVGLFVESAGGVALNQWTHVAVTYDAAVGWAIYLNGILDSSSGSITGAVGTDPGDLRIGADRESGGPTYFWQGYLDEVRIWSIARTGPQILQTLYDGAGRPYISTPPYDRIRLCLDMQLPAVSFVFDRATAPGEANNSASFVNGATTTAEAAPPVSYNVGLQMNGTDDYGVIPMGDGFASGLTIEAWVAPYSYTGFPAIVGRDFTSSFWLGLNNVGRLRFYPTGGVGNYVESFGIIPLNAWTHVAVTYKAGMTKFYINDRADNFTTAIAGAVGENGRFVFVGADNEPAAPAYHFNGILDEVRVTRGALSAAAILRGIYLGYTGFISPFNVLDESNASVEQWRADFDGFEITQVVGSSARLVRSGAAMWSAISGVASLGVQNYHNSILALGPVPEGEVYGSVGTNLPVNESVPISDVNVWLVAPTTNLSGVTVRVRSPALTWVNLVTAGSAIGRDLHTVFDDGSANTLGGSIAPYTDTVQPSAALSTFNGELSNGSWRMEISGLTVGLWAWGLQINHEVLSVPPQGDRGVISIRNAGSNPVQGSGSLAYELPREADVDLALFDVQGRRVLTMRSGRQPAGSAVVGWSAADLGSGLYFVRLTVDGVERGRLKVTVLR